MRGLAVVLAVCAVLSGCSKGKGVMPQELPALAGQFKQAPAGTEKIELAKKIQPLLPTCMRTGPDGSMAVIEYDKPTYFLRLPELYQLLGTPAEQTDEYCAYDLGTGEKASYYLLLDVYDDYISAARIDVGK